MYWPTPAKTEPKGNFINLTQSIHPNVWHHPPGLQLLCSSLSFSVQHSIYSSSLSRPCRLPAPQNSMQWDLVISYYLVSILNAFFFLTLSFFSLLIQSSIRAGRDGQSWRFLNPKRGTQGWGEGERRGASHIQHINASVYVFIKTHKRVSVLGGGCVCVCVCVSAMAAECW